MLSLHSNNVIMISMILSVSFVVAFLISFLCMPPFIRLMEKYRILDKSGGRKIHKGYTAHMGGLVIFLAFAFSFALFATKDPYLTNIWEIVSFILLFALVVFMGIRDDMNDLSPRVKLLIEIIVGFLFCYMGIRIHGLYGLFGIEELPEWLSYILTISFIIVVANAYNLIDGIDGQAGTQALSVFFFLLLYGLFVVGLDIKETELFASSSFWIIVDVAMCGAIMGFLFYNWQPAKVFMGDTGSLFIGFMIAIRLIVSMDYNGIEPSTLFKMPVKSNILVFVMFFFLPLADTLRVFISRVRRGKSPFSADKIHIHHLLLRTGYTHQKTTIITMSIQIVVTIISIIAALFLEDMYYIAYIVVMWFVFVLGLRYFIKKKLTKIKENL